MDTTTTMLYRMQLWGEELPCKLELSNPEDRFAVVVVWGEVTIGHVPKRISSICSSFLRRGGMITCKITGTRQYSADLPQGGLEIPCQLHFEGNNKDLDKAESLIQYAMKACTTSLEVRKQSTVIISKSPKTLVCIDENNSSDTAVKVEQSHNSSIKIKNSLRSSVKVDKSPGCSVNVSECTSSCVKVTNSDCSVVNVSACSSSKSPTDASINLTGLPAANANKSKYDATKVQLVDFTEVEPNTSVESNQVLLGSHCKRTSTQPNDRRKKSKNFCLLMKN